MSGTTEKKTEVQHKLFSEARGQYSLIKNDKAYFFQFPIANSVEENFLVVSILKDELRKTLEKQRIIEEAKKEEPVKE
jgi:hypothetical protein